MSLAAVTLSLAGCKDEQTAAEQPRPVKTVIAAYSEPARTLLYSGVVQPRIESTLGFRVSGKLVERLVNTGDTVRPGQVLARIDPVDLRLSEAAQKANVEAAKTRVAVAKAALERSRRLLVNNFVSQAAFDSAKLELDSAQGALDAAEAQYRQNRNQVEYADLTAQADGVITAVNAEPGQVVSTGQAVLTMAETGDVEVGLALPEHELKNVQPGLAAVITLWADPGVKADGKIREIAAAADPATRTYTVRVSVIQPPPAMRLGMTANVTFSVAAKPEIRVPLAAITKDGDATVVWVVNADTATVSPRAVTVSRLADDGVRLSGGLAEGERVVAAGVQFLIPGQKVRLDAGAISPVAHNR